MTAPAPPRQVEVQLDTGLRPDVKKLGLLFTGVGSVIGSGWLFGSLGASQLAGPLAIFAWIIGGIMFILIGLAYAELGVMFPVSGGVVRFPQYAFGSFASYSCGWITWLAAAAVTPIEVLAVTQYADPYLPWLMYEDQGLFILTGPGIGVAVGLMLLFSLVNVVAVKAFAQLNNVLVWWKLAIIALVVVVFFAVSFNTENFTAGGGFAPYGYGAMLGAISTSGIAFAYLGFRQGIEFAGETNNPQKNVPFAVIGTLIITMTIYVLLQIAFITALPADRLGGGWAKLSFEAIQGPLAGLALLLGVSWLAVLLYIDAIVSPGDTGLIFAATTARLAYANGRNRNAPEWLTRLNRFGVPWLAVVLMFVVGCLFFLPFPGWYQFVGFVTSAMVLSFGFGPLVVGALRRQLPDQDRPFRLPGKDTIPYLAFVSTNLIVFWAGWATNEKIFASVLIGYVVFVVYHFVAPDRVPPVEFKHGSWFILWMVGLAVISFLGSYGNDPATAWIDAGGTGLIPQGWGILVMAVFSAVIYWYAVSVRLPADRVVANVQRRTLDEEPPAMATR